jgi:hypothetical protein
LLDARIGAQAERGAVPPATAGLAARRSRLEVTMDQQSPLSLTEFAQMLRAFPATLLGEVGILPEPVLVWRPGPEEWCVREVVGHLIEVEERGFASRIRALLVEPEPVFTAWDPEAVARERGDAAKGIGELLKTFLELRVASAVLVEQLSVDDLDRAGEHPEVGRLTAGDLLAEWVHHDREHLRQIMANVQAYVWPQLGGAQRFKSAPVQ